MRSIIKATTVETKEEAKDVRSFFFAELKADGFKKVATKTATKAGSKMGRSAAYYGSTSKSITTFEHTDGRKIEVQMSCPKHRDSSVSVWSV